MTSESLMNQLGPESQFCEPVAFGVSTKDIELSHIEKNIVGIISRFFNYWSEGKDFDCQVVIFYIPRGMGLKNYILCDFVDRLKSQQVRCDIQVNSSLKEFEHSPEYCMRDFFNSLRVFDNNREVDLSNTIIALNCDYLGVGGDVDAILTILKSLDGLDVNNVEVNFNLCEIPAAVTNIHKLASLKSENVLFDDKENVLKFWSGYWLLNQARGSLKVPKSHLAEVFSFLNDVKDYLKPEDIETAFLPHWSKDENLNIQLCRYIISLVGDGEVTDPRIKSFMDNGNLTFDDIGVSGKSSFLGFPVLSFNEKSLSAIKIQAFDGVYFASNKLIQKKFIGLLMSLIRSPNVRFYTKVSKASYFSLPSGESGYFLETQEGYDFAVLQKALMAAVACVVSEFEKKAFTISKGFQKKYFIERFESHIHRCSLDDMCESKVLATEGDGLPEDDSFKI